MICHYLLINLRFGLSQKVFRSWLFCGYSSDILRGRLENFIIPISVFIQLKNSSYISTSVAVIWCWPYGHKSLVKLFTVPFHDELMRSSNQFRAIFCIENFYSVLAEDITCSSRGNTPPFYLFRVWPHQITHWSFVWNLLLPINCLNLIKCVNVGWKSSMHTEHFLIYQCRQREEIEYLSAISPHIDWPVLSKAFVIKAINLCNLPTLMAASYKCDILWVPDLQCQ